MPWSVCKRCLNSDYLVTILFSWTTSGPWNYYFNWFIPSWITQSCLCRQCPSSALQCFWYAGTLWPFVCLFKMWQQSRIIFCFSKSSPFSMDIWKIVTMKCWTLQGSLVLLFGGASFVAMLITTKNASKENSKALMDAVNFVQNLKK